MKPRNKFPLAYFLIAYFFTWAFQIPVVLDSQKIISLPVAPQLFLLISIFGPFVSAFYLTWRENRFSGAWKLFKRGFDFRFSWYVYLFVALVPLSIAFFGFLAVNGKQINTDVVSLITTFVLYFFLGGSFGEEYGWRGFALPRLLEIYNVSTATIILGILWAVWHLPLFWLAGTSQYYTPIWLYFIYVTALAFQYTWVFLRTKGSIFACLLLHTFTNMTVEVFPVEVVGAVDNRIYYETIFAVFIAVILILLPEKKTEKEKKPKEND